MKKLLFISNLFPNLFEPNLATFNKQQIRALSRYFVIDVIAPISWKRRFNQRNNVFYSDYNFCKAFYPTFWNTPGIFRHFNGVLFKFSISNTINRLTKKKQYSAIFSSWLFPDSWAAAAIAKKLKIPLYVKVHGTDVNELNSGERITSMSLSVVHRSQRVICVSRALKDKLTEMGCNCTDIDVIYNGIDTNVFYKKEIKKNEKKKYLLYVGNLKKEKGLTELLKAFSILKTKLKNINFRLVIIGDGPFKKSMMKLISDLDIDSQIDFLGALPSEQVSTFMNVSDILCLPSYMEGVPNVVLEALACGCPVVATDVGGIPELANQSLGITLVKPKSVESLLIGIEEILRKNEEVTLPYFIGSWEDNAIKISNIINGKLG